MSKLVNDMFYKAQDLFFHGLSNKPIFLYWDDGKYYSAKPSPRVFRSYGAPKDPSGFKVQGKSDLEVKVSLPPKTNKYGANWLGFYELTKKALEHAVEKKAPYFSFEDPEHPTRRNIESSIPPKIYHSGTVAGAAFNLCDELATLGATYKEVKFSATVYLLNSKK